jgi:hypothetical protein
MPRKNPPSRQRKICRIDPVAGNTADTEARPDKTDFRANRHFVDNWHRSVYFHENNIVFIS